MLDKRMPAGCRQTVHSLELSEECLVLVRPTDRQETGLFHFQYTSHADSSCIHMALIGARGSGPVFRHGLVRWVAWKVAQLET